MADPANTGGGDPTGTSAGSSPSSQEFKVPDGKVLIDAQEHLSFQRMREQNAGWQKFHQEAASRGFKRAEDFSGFDKFQGVLKNRGMTMEQVAALLQADGQPSQKDDIAGMSAPQMEKFLSDQGYVRKADLDSRDAHVLALTDHKTGQAREQELIKKGIAELLGENPSDWDKFAIENAVKGYLADPSRSRLYDDGHPLAAEQFRPHDEESLKPVWEAIKKARTVAEGAGLRKLGEAANRVARSTPAGNSGGQGRPKDERDSMNPMDRIRDTIERSKSAAG